MISEIYILFFKASLTIRHTATVSQKKSGTSKKIQRDFQISRVGSLDFLDLKVNGSPVFCARLFICALWSPAGKGLTSWLSFVVSSLSLSLSLWYPGSGVVLDCIDS